MFYLGLAISLASLPGYTSATIPAGWAAMSLFLPLTLWKEAKLTSFHILFLCFLGWAALSLTWAPEWRDGIFRLWQLTLIYLAFRLGSITTDLCDIVRGLVTGCVVSSALSIVQYLGLQPVLQLTYGGEAPGLFFNHVIAGQTLALMFVASLIYGLWWQGLALLPGIYLSGSRGAWIVIALGLLFTFIRKPALLLFIILSGLLAVTHSISSHDLERIMIWKAALANLSWFGHGSGSFISLYLGLGDKILHPVDTHNDLLQLLFEFGLGAGYFVALIFACCLRKDRDEWPILACFVFLGFFAFPLFTPLTVCLAALCAGRIVAVGDWSWDLLPIRRHAQLLWGSVRQAGLRKPSGEGLSVPLRASKES